MSSGPTMDDHKVASLAAGFTFGFGFLTVWEAIKQTRRNKNPLRSMYIYMIWGEIVANLGIGVLGWLFLDGTLSATVPTFFFILLFYVFEVQLLMQIIINRIAIISETEKIVRLVKWGTVAIITVVNIAVFCIFIPAHIEPPASDTFVLINKYWDRTSKVLILIVDAALNWYFLRTVKVRLLEQHGLVKYTPLVKFNAKLMVLSMAMDVMLIGLMSLPNPIVFIQFHPVAYMVKLNIEMSMASLITRLARGGKKDAHSNSLSYTGETNSKRRRNTIRNQNQYNDMDRDLGLKSFTRSKARATEPEELEMPHTGNGIQRRMDFEITVHETAPNKSNNLRRGSAVAFDIEDEMSLTHNPGHPNHLERKTSTES